MDDQTICGYKDFFDAKMRVSHFGYEDFFNANMRVYPIVGMKISSIQT